MSKCTCVRPEAILNGVCANCEFPVTPKPEAPDVQKLIANGEHACQTGDCGHGRGYECEAQLAQDAKPAKDAGAREWPTEMLKNLDASLKLQSMLAAPDHAWIGPSVIEVATAAYEKLERELAEAERRLFESAIKNANEFLHLREQLTQERAKSAALVEATESLAKTSRTVAEEIFTDVNCEGKLANQFMGDIIDVEEALAKWGKG